MTVSPEKAMEIARRYSMKMQRIHRDKGRGIDHDDIYGDILLRYVEYPPKDEREMWICAKFATTDWMRRQFGREGQKSAAIQYAPSYVINGNDGEVEDLDQVGALVDETPEIVELLHCKFVRDALPLVLNERDVWIALCILDGWVLSEIGEMLGVTESRVSQLLTRMQPKLRRLMGLSNVEKVDDRGHRTRGSSGAGRLATSG